MKKQKQIDELWRRNAELWLDIEAIIKGKKRVINQYKKVFKNRDDAIKALQPLCEALKKGLDYTPDFAKGKKGKVESLKPFPEITAGETWKFWEKLPKTKDQYLKTLY
jgi:hypothetical protein